jgi:phosphoserine phosphatase RsbU/P
MKKVNLIFGAILSVSLIMIVPSCKKESPITPERKIEIALDEFVSKLILNPPSTADISDRIKNYLIINSNSFFGATVALLDSTNKAIYSPYWYRLNNTLEVKNLADSAYHINEQLWIRQAIDGGKPIWTDPYFDAGGGDIWMKTRSVPVYINGKIIAVATTDLSLE